MEHSISCHRGTFDEVQGEVAVPGDGAIVAHTPRFGEALPGRDFTIVGNCDVSHKLGIGDRFYADNAQEKLLSKGTPGRIHDFPMARKDAWASWGGQFQR